MIFYQNNTWTWTEAIIQTTQRKKSKKAQTICIVELIHKKFFLCISQITTLQIYRNILCICVRIDYSNRHITKSLEK